MTLAGAGGFAAAVEESCRAAGAEVERLAGNGEEAPAAAAERIVTARGAVEALVVDASTAGEGDVTDFQAAIATAWNATRAAANAAMVPEARGGKVVLLAPPPGAGEFAAPARAALENMARTLSIEWSRFQIRITAIHPGDDTTPGDVAGITAYLASPAGDYFSGCVLTLGAVAAAAGA